MYTHIAPSFAPIGLSVISQLSSSLTLAWMAPPLERQNGLITGYSINVTNSDTGASMLLSSSGNSITVAELSPYTSYLCSVAAQTIVGLGPYTSSISVTTGEDGKNKLASITSSRTIMYIFFLNSSSGKPRFTGSCVYLVHLSHVVMEPSLRGAAKWSTEALCARCSGTRLQQKCYPDIYRLNDSSQ